MKDVRTMIEKDIVGAKKTLSFEVTKFVRGEEDAIIAQKMSENLFADGGDDAPIFEIEKSECPIGICDLLFECGLAPSKSEARRLVQGGAITFKGNKVERFDMLVSAEDIGDGALLKKGKKNFLKIQLI